MKSLSKLMFALLFSLATTTGFSQTSKPKIFAAFPNTINCTVSEFFNAFHVTEGQHIILSFSDNFKFSGTVISNVVKYSNLQSMTIKSDLSDKTIFHLSKQINDDNSVSYVGRIIDPTASDGYQVKKDMAGNYQFEKTDAEKILQECKQ
jgi:hypothetical protein